MASFAYDKSTQRLRRLRHDYQLGFLFLASIRRRRLARSVTKIKAIVGVLVGRWRVVHTSLAFLLNICYHLARTLLSGNRFSAIS
jgi:hypothetical protein